MREEVLESLDVALTECYVLLVTTVHRGCLEAQFDVSQLLWPPVHASLSRYMYMYIMATWLLWFYSKVGESGIKRRRLNVVLQ